MHLYCFRNVSGKLDKFYFTMHYFFLVFMEKGPYMLVPREHVRWAINISFVISLHTELFVNGNL